MKVCFIGLGSIGTRHCRNLFDLCREKGIPLTIHALRSSDRPLQQQLHGLPITVLHGYDELHNDYDAVFLTNPTAMHYETLFQVGGKARCFFIEKPVFQKTDEDVSALPLRADSVCYVAAPLRYTKVLREAMRVVAEHRVFSIRAISSSYLPDWRPGTDYRQTYSAHRNMGGGVSIDLIHEWDYLTMLFGFPQKVFSIIGKVSNLEIDSDDIAAYIADYGDKVAEVHLDYFGRQIQRYLELFTEVGTYRFDIANAAVWYPDGTQQMFLETVNDKYVEEMKYFLTLVGGEAKESSNSIVHAVRVLKLTGGMEYQA